MDDMRKGCWDQKARLEDMDVNHVEASLAFPSFPRFCGQTFTERKDKELGDLCVKAYNDWMFDEWCAGTNDRLIPLIIVQLWDPKLAAAEVRRNAARGSHAVTFSEIPPFLGLPSMHDKDGYWDPFLQACEETDTVVCMHIGSSSKMPSTSADAPAAVGSTLTYMNAAMSLTDWLMSGLFERFPRLKIAYSEGQIGWIPYVLERADKVWEDNRGLGRRRRQGASARRRSTTTSTSTAASSTTRTGCKIARRGRRRQRHVRDRLPAQRLDLAAHQEGGGGDHEGSHPGAGRQDLPHQRDRDAPPQPVDAVHSSGCVFPPRSSRPGSVSSPQLRRGRGSSARGAGRTGCRRARSTPGCRRVRAVGS